MNSQKINRQIRLFHGSPIQGLKYIKPRQESINANVGDCRGSYR